MTEDEQEAYKWERYVQLRDEKIAAQCKRSKLPKDTSGCLVGRKWEYADYAALIGAIKEDVTIMDFARTTNRSASGVEARLVKLGLIRAPSIFTNQGYVGSNSLSNTHFTWSDKITRRRQKVVSKKGDVIIDIGVLLLAMGWERKEWDAIFVPSMFANKPIKYGV